jgi:hypothetical protein
LSLATVVRFRSIITIIAGIAAIGVSVALTFLEWSSPGHSAVAPENGPLAIRLALLAGLGWTFIGLGIGSAIGAKTRSSRIIAMAMSGALFGGLMGFFAWIAISIMLTS